ncbi:MAG: hypothetical protein MK213_03595 [Planctomycetes bacterium]|nr:hypothetical protein [Planctomycetota bacterium]
MKTFISGFIAVSLVFLTSCASIATDGDSCCSSDGEACCSEEKAAQCCADAATLGKDCEKCK